MAAGAAKREQPKKRGGLLAGLLVLLLLALAIWQLAVMRDRLADARAEQSALAESVAASYGGSVEVEWIDFASPLVNDAAAAAELKALTEASFPEKRVVTDRAVSLTGDDFAEFILDTPGAYAYLGTADPARPETQHNIHSADFDIDERALPFGAWLHAASAIRWLSAD